MSEKGEDRGFTRRVELSDGRVEALRQTREQVERDDEEGLVRLVIVDRVLLVLLEGNEGGFDDLDAAFEDRLGVVGEPRSDGDYDRRQALHEQRIAGVSESGGQRNRGGSD